MGDDIQAIHGERNIAHELITESEIHIGGEDRTGSNTSEQEELRDVVAVLRAEATDDSNELVDIRADRHRVDYVAVEIA